MTSISVGIIYSRPWCKKWLERELRKHLPNPFLVARRVIVVRVGDIPPLNIPLGLDAKVYNVPENTSIGVSRNLILDACDTPYLAWQDDDDWHSEYRLDCLATILDNKQDWGLGAPHGWTYDFRNHTLRRLEFRLPCAGTSIYNVSAVREFSFDSESPGSDARWLRKIRAELGNESKLRCEGCAPHSLFIRHGFNTCADPNGISYCTSALFTRFGFPEHEYDYLREFCHEARVSAC